MSETVTGLITRVYEAQAREAAAQDEQKRAIERIAFLLALPPHKVSVYREAFCVRDGGVHTMYNGRWCPETSERVVERREAEGVLVATMPVYGFSAPSYEGITVRPLTSERDASEWREE
jgi:hypothetical protein